MFISDDLHDAIYKAKVPIWVHSAIKARAKEMGIGLGDLIQGILSDYVYSDVLWESKIDGEARTAYYQYRKRDKRQMDWAMACRQRQDEGLE